MVVDGKPLRGQPTGVGRVLAGVLGGLEAVGVSDLELDVAVPPPGGRTLPWIQLGLARRARGADVLYCPFYYRPLVAPCPTVVVLHDLLVLSHPEWFPRRGRHPFGDLLRWSARHATRLVTPSESVRDEAVARLDVDPERVTAIAWGVDATHFRPLGDGGVAPVLARRGLHRPYLLHVGSLHPRRGLDVALGVLADLLPRWPDVELVAVGREEQAWGRIPPALAGKVRLLGYVPEAELPALMSGAALGLALSRGEGFDLPLLESLACGAPVVASDIAVHREHFAPWARLVPVADRSATAAAVAGLLESPPGAADRAAQAAAVAARFSWTETALAHLALWRRAAEGGP